MKPLIREDLYSLEQYAELRPRFRAEVMAHKKRRKCFLGEHLSLSFEDRLTVQYQIQEMLRIERIFDGRDIQAELDAYNPLVPDGHNLKATMMIEYSDVEERRAALAGLIGIENTVWMKVETFDPVFAIADEDLERTTEEKTSSVHFLRFEFTRAMRTIAKKGGALSLGVDHINYRHVVVLSDELRDSLLQDFY